MIGGDFGDLIGEDFLDDESLIPMVLIVLCVFVAIILLYVLFEIPVGLDIELELLTGIELLALAAITIGTYLLVLIWQP